MDLQLVQHGVEAEIIVEDYEAEYVQVKLPPIVTNSGHVIKMSPAYMWIYTFLFWDDFTLSKGVEDLEKLSIKDIKIDGLVAKVFCMKNLPISITRVYNSGETPIESEEFSLLSNL